MIGCGGAAHGLALMFVPIVESMNRSGALVSVSHPSEIVSETLVIVGLVGACCLAAGAAGGARHRAVPV